ncbi:MAG: conjugative transposon protein TraN [Rikenellaceae bacterium]
MKKLILTLAIVAATSAAMAQSVEPFQGITKSIGLDKMVTPHGLEVTHDKTVHIIFPAAVSYVDLGSANIVAGKAEAAENVLRVKSTVEWFEDQTNMSVITDDGSFYAFNVRYSDEPMVLNVEMKNPLHGADRSDNSLEVRLSALGEESPERVNLILKSVYDDKRKRIRGIGSKSFKVEYMVRSIYTHNGLLYLHTLLDNDTNISFDIELVTFKIVDRKVAKRTAMQEQTIEPLRVYNEVTQVSGKRDERTVYALEKFTIPKDKQLLIEVHERNGGRHQTLKVRSRDLLQAKTIKEL